MSEPASPSSRPGLIDYWCNGFTPDLRVEWENGLQNSPINFSEQLAESFAEPEVFVERMDADGVQAVLIPSVHQRKPAGYSPFFDGQPEPDMTATTKLAESYPGRILGLFSIDPNDSMRGVRALEHSVRDLGFVGAHLHTHSWDRRLDHRDYYPYYAKCEELQVPVVLQVGHSAGLAPSESGRPFTADRPAIYFKSLPFILSHTGWPWVDEAIAMAWKHPNVYVGTATHQPRFWTPAFAEFALGRGARKVLVGSGLPVLRHRPLLEQIDLLAITPEVRDSIVHHNAAALFGLE